MKSCFDDKNHKERFLKLMTDDQTKTWDKERISLFYILSGNADLYAKRSAIYDSKEHMIKLCLKSRKVDFSSSEISLIRLGFNLYNGYRDNHTTPLHLFWNLDQHNHAIAMNAIQLRFKKNANLLD